MRLKLVTVLGLCLLISAVFQPAVFAEEAPPARTIPFNSIGFGAKLSPDGKTLVTFENIILRDLKEVDPTLLPMRVIDISTGEERGQLSGYSDYAADVVFTTGGKRMVSSHMNGDINIWDMASLKVIKSFHLPIMGMYLPIKMFPDNNHILVFNGGIPQSLLVVDLQTGAITQTLGKRFDSFLDYKTNYIQFPQQGDIMFASFTLSPDGKQVATATANDEVGIWTLADNQYQVLREKSEKYALFSIRQMVFTPDSKSLIYYDYSDKMMHIRDIAAKSDKTVANIGSDTFALSADGRMIAWATLVKDGPDTVSIAPIDAPDKATVLLTLPEDVRVTSRVTWLEFLKEGKQVVAGGFFTPEDVPNQIYVLDVPA